MEVEQSAPEDLKKDLLLAHEISFAKALSGNDKKLRDKAVKKLMKWLAMRSKGKIAFTEEDFRRIWAGLFYCMWMSDKFLIQEELAESISKLTHCFQSNKHTALLFIKSFYKLMSFEWPGIDQHRIDKFSMLVRRFLRQNLEYCKRNNWDISFAKELTEVFENTILCDGTPTGLLIHFIDIFPEEFAKISRGKVTREIVLTFLESFIKLMAFSTDPRSREAINRFFQYLMRQTDAGLEYETKLVIWKRRGMPTKSPNNLELCKIDDDKMEEDSDVDEPRPNAPLDPRAGRVNAILPQIKIDAEGVIKLIKKYLPAKGTVNEGRRSLKTLETKFLFLQRGKLPEYIAKPDILCETHNSRRRNAKSVKELMRFTQQLKDKELDLLCEDEFDNDDDDDNDSEQEQEDCETLEKDKSRKVEKSNGEVNEISERSNNKKKVKRKSRRKKEKHNVSSQPVEEHVKDNVGKVKNPTSKKNTENSKDKTNGKTKSNETKENETLRPKPLKEAFKVEDISKEGNKLVITPSRKRRLLSSWQVHDLEENSEEYSKIKVPKIIKLETKRNGPLVVVQDDEAERESNAVTKSTQVKLTPTFWERAKKKVAKKDKKTGSSLFLNPLYTGEQSKNSKRISFALDRNETQENEEYLQEVKNSPCIPFDGSRKPVQSALKSGLSPSPINPFYRFRKFK